MPSATAIDPDDFLDFSRAEPFSRAEGTAAWEQAYASLEQALSALGSRAELHIVMGLQASGKSTWVRQQRATAADAVVFFSGPLPSRGHRQRALALATRFGCRAVAVWINTPLEVCIARNRLRSGLARIPEPVIDHVARSLEPPTPEEGFHEVVVVEQPVDV